jgi:UDP-N-acetylmuramyl pentapeptide phosphotransferase/UDP-N-acetylglucosamine-1-phosphate transferase
MSPDSLIALQIAGVAFFVSLSVTGFASLGGLGDIPDHRSSHARVTPTGGGLGIIAGIGAGVLLAGLFYQDRIFAQFGSAQRLASLMSLTFAVAFLGLLDDRYVLSSKLKFGIIFLLSVCGAVAVGPVTRLPMGEGYLHLLWGAGLAGTVLWLFTVTNAVNFIDGINGLFGLSLAIASAALCALALKVGAPVTALIAMALAASLLGFLPYNLRNKAAVFSGDCGSLGAAFLYAGAVLLLVREQPHAPLLYAGPLLILPLLTDVLLTLVRKPKKGLALLAPHNTHIYQRWARLRGNHVTVSLIYGIMAAFMAILVHEAFGVGTLGSLAAFGITVGVFVGLYLIRSATLPD